MLSYVVVQIRLNARFACRNLSVDRKSPNLENRARGHFSSESPPSLLRLSEIPGTHLFYGFSQRYTYRVLQTIQMKLILLCVWAELAVLGSTKTALKFKYEI